MTVMTPDPTQAPDSASSSGPALEATVHNLASQLASLSEAIHRLGQQSPARPAPLWTDADVAKRLSVSTRTVQRLVETGEFACLRIGGQRRYDPRAIEAYLKSSAKPRKRRPARRPAPRASASA